ncbi:hypothetical protein EI546_01885 [Aequorivita sp. H23M31]|uniref:Type I restriction modification DNA specificity domain-containing protein n=1 Tax=Aequorivita ciconiae TaxID=2494375 RepID=A0A410FZW2_9FLAO|nr:restriction endonuclease subunit S [Aequorivita sp. H23M31]QAA80554.1 hypothetical protein EI546_01885 [Aequorivita sp. H23M31]
MKLGDVLKLNKKSLIDIEDNQTYKISGVQNYGQGIVIRREVLGYELNMKKYQLISKNQLMWCKVDTKNGAFGLTHDEHIGSLASTNMALADINVNLVNPEFLEVLFRQKTFADYITKYSSGTTNRKYLTPKQLFEKIELPNLNLFEQQEFIAKLKRIEKIGLESEIQTQKKLLSQLKQSILQEAIQGKLTADWRALQQAQGPQIEPASELLKRIKAEKAQLIKDKKIKREKALPPISEKETPFELPDGWLWCRFGEYSLFERGRFSIRPRNDPSYFDGKIPFIQIGSLSLNGDRINSFNQTLNERGLKVSKLFPKNTVVIAIVGGTIGYLGVLGKDMCFPDSIIGIKPTELTCSKFVLLQLRAQQKTIKELSYQMSGQPNIKLPNLTNLIIPLPPLEEQKAIVEIVETLMQKCQALEQEIKTSEANAQMLMQAVLKEAFEGEREVVENV